MIGVNELSDDEPFERELERLINRHSVENESDTPDYILAEYLRNCLDLFQIAVRKRDAWHGFEPWSKRDFPVQDNK